MNFPAKSTLNLAKIGCVGEEHVLQHNRFFFHHLGFVVSRKQCPYIYLSRTILLSKYIPTHFMIFDS